MVRAPVTVHEYEVLVLKIAVPFSAHLPPSVHPSHE